MAAYDGDIRTPDTMAGGGGGRIHFDPNDVSAARPVFDAATGQWQWVMPNGGQLSGDAGRNGNSPYGPYQGGYRNDPSFMPPPSLQNNETFFGPNGGGASAPATGGGGGGGGALPTWIRHLAPALATLPAAVNHFGGNDQTSMSPELQQLLALALKRMSSQQPLFDAINQQALAGLPNRQG